MVPYNPVLSPILGVAAVVTPLVSRLTTAATKVMVTGYCGMVGLIKCNGASSGKLSGR